MSECFNVLSGVTILFKKPTAKDPYLFSFLSPLSLGVWIYIVTAYLAVSLLLYILARLVLSYGSYVPFNFVHFVCNNFVSSIELFLYSFPLLLSYFRLCFVEEQGVAHSYEGCFCVALHKYVSLFNVNVK